MKIVGDQFERLEIFECGMHIIYRSTAFALKLIRHS